MAKQVKGRKSKEPREQQIIAHAFSLSIYLLISSSASVILAYASEDAYAASWIFRHFAFLTLAYLSVELDYIPSQLRDRIVFCGALALHLQAAMNSFAISLLKA